MRPLGPDPVRRPRVTARSAPRSRRARVWLCFSLVTSERPDLILRRGRVIDPESGRDEVAVRLIDAQVKEILGLTEKALDLAKKAQIADAQAMIAEAVAGLPRNVGILLAAAQINLLFLSQHGLNVEVVNRVRGYLATLETLAPGTERVIKMAAKAQRGKP